MNLLNDILIKINNYKEICIAVASGLVAIVEFIIIFTMNKKQKKQDRKFKAYSGYMIKIDRIMSNISNDPSKILEFYGDFLKSALNNTGDEKSINETLIKFNDKIKEFVINASEPLIILRQELNQLKLICSNELLVKIEKMEQLTLDYNNEVQKSLSAIIPNDINSTSKELQTLTQDERWRSFESLNNDILKIMRKEIGS